MKHSLLKTIFTAFIFLSLAVFLNNCQGNAPKPNVTQATPAAAAVITPVPFPTNIVPGFKFPEDTATIINGWLGGYTSPYFDTVSIYKHAWGIWAGLTAKSGQSWNQQELLVFETWSGISEIRTLVQEGKTDCPTQKGAPMLEKPRQFNHAKALFSGNAAQTATVDDTPGFWVTVAYDPSAACHATKYKLLDSAVIVPKIKPGAISSIPAFPRTAITTKPTYFVGKVTDNLIQIPVWSGAPSPANNYPLSDWPDYVYVDVKNSQPAGKVLVPASGANPTPAQISAATCNLSDFIYFKLDSLAAKYLNQQQSTEGDTAQAGDLALLVAMHVTTKEISNWTWQTYFWTPDPANPLFPSNKVAAGLRPSQLQGAASHYAVSTAYAMVRPNQPITGGTNKGVTPVIGYNPYLEPGLGAINGNPPNSFPNKLSPAIKWGVQSNCMSCHALAAFPGSPYSADQYISLNDPIFLGQVQLDFAWSLQSPSNMTNTAGTTAKK
jgi:hypothetical protein